MENGEYSPAGSTGLALTVGELREKVARLKEELTRAETDLHGADTRDKSELSGIDQRQQAALDALSRNLSVLNERVAALEAKATAKPAPPPLPKRTNGERPDAYRTRVAAWARQNGKAEPPQVGVFDNGSGFADKVARAYGVT